MMTSRHTFTSRLRWGAAISFLALSAAAVPAAEQAPAARAAQQPLKFYELRTYHAAPGKFKDVMDEFREWIAPGIAKVGMTPIAYWSTEGEGEGKGSGAVVYVLAFANRAERDAAWERFRKDPEIDRGRQATNAKIKAGDGVRFIAKVDTVFMTMTDFSPHPKTASGATLE